MAKKTTSYWFPYTQVEDLARPRLFCLPYAGGSAAVFRNWMRALAPFVEVCPIQLPGRGGHRHRSPFTSMNLLVEAIDQAISDLLDRPFAIFGHSMGATIGFELAQRLRRERGLEPFQLFVSGRGAPQIGFPGNPTYNLEDAEFIEILRQLQGTPDEVLINSEMLSLLLPLLRADFQLIQTYEYTSYTKLQCPIVAFGGTKDPDITQEKLQAWHEQTSAEFSLHMFPGNHFFLQHNELSVLQAIAEQLQRKPL